MSNEALEILLYRRLIEELNLKGRLDELIVELALDPAYLPGQAEALASIARGILVQLKVRIPPELERLASMFPNLQRDWHVRRDRPSNAPMSVAPMSVAPLMRELLIFGSVLVALLFFAFLAFVLVAQYFLAFGMMVLMVVLAIVLLVGLIRYPGGPRSIPEAQFEAEIRSSREEFFPRHEPDRDGEFGTGIEETSPSGGIER